MIIKDHNKGQFQRTSLRLLRQSLQQENIIKDHHKGHNKGPWLSISLILPFIRNKDHTKMPFSSFNLTIEEWCLFNPQHFNKLDLDIVPFDFHARIQVHMSVHHDRCQNYYTRLVIKWQGYQLRGRPLIIWMWGWRKLKKKIGGPFPGKNKFRLGCWGKILHTEGVPRKK